ncbi:PREDICTED: epithelial splicing regulatory protein 1-like isoform X2 [Priapulus caudatus]|uniref:Epithelial splicing regulatory protein 1-like isoform X2 n=1 Tax=Priapulus caudatus TaxID=37621 RepID=A0ABM1ESE4_PRICU|nr:PREDICTED: epithelial splicing regulatory protein 1-like isoform X2 [Priapulus caudatus]
MAAAAYLVVFYCATSGQNDENLGADEEEIVLLVWLVIDIANNKVVAVQHSYVKPQTADINDVILTEDCRQQTGLQENAIKSAQPLEQVLEQFDQFARTKLHGDAGGSFHFVTDGQLHFRQCLHPEAGNKNVELPPYFYSFFDLRKEFKKFYHQVEDVSCVKDMLDYIGLEVDESAEFGIRHGQEMGKIIQRMLHDGHRFENPEPVNARLEAGLCSKDEEIDTNCVIRARGLPWQSSDQDIAKFFRGLNIMKGGVALCLSAQGRRNGEALVRFIDQEHRDLALKRHKHHIGQRYIEVYKATGEDFISVAAGNNNEATAFLSRGAQVIVRMRGLPYDTSAKDIITFFVSGENPCNVMDGEEGILFVHKPDGRATGDAFVLFANEEDVGRALKKHREIIGSRYIELFRSTTAEVQQVLNRTMDPKTYEQQAPLITNVPQVPLMPQHIITSGSRKDCIRLRGLPFEARVENILEFLGEHAKSIVYQGVHMVFNAQGQPSGEAFIQMSSEHAAFMGAAERHHKNMYIGKKQRYIEVFQCSGDDMNVVLQGNTLMPQPYTYPYAAIPQSPGIIPMHSPLSPLSPAGRAPAYISPVYYWPYPSPYPSPPVSPTSYYQHNGPTVIVMRGLPFNASTADILNFFQGFPEVQPDSVQLHRNADGRPSGDAYVTFLSRTEAERSIQEKNRQNIGNRYIELFMA